MGMIVALFLFFIQIALAFWVQNYFSQDLQRKINFYSQQVNLLLCERLNLEYEASRKNLNLSMEAFQSKHKDMSKVNLRYMEVHEFLEEMSMQVKSQCQTIRNNSMKLIFEDIQNIGVHLVEQSTNEEPYRANWKLTLDHK